MTSPRHTGDPLPDLSEPFDPTRLQAAEEALRVLPVPNEDSRRYLEKHISRLARTMALVPPPGETGRVLELGCYMQITPLLERLSGYREVRGAYYGKAGKSDRKTIRFPDGKFTCRIDHFDAELDPFPYRDGYFDLVIAGEILEHMVFDPMHLLLESRRVLVEGGRILVTTPNVASVTSLAKILDGGANPQIYSVYKRPSGEPEIGHMREYTAWELGETMKAAGFEIEQLFTTFLEEYESHRPLLELLEASGYNTENRGQQTWCVARKRSDLPVNRYPLFLYDQ